MLYNGEQIGDGSPPVVDIAVDPLEGTTLCAPRHAQRSRRDRPGRARHDVRPRPLRLHGEDRRRRGDRRPARPRPAAPETLKLIAERKGGSVGDVTVVMLDRPRHEEAMREVREAGARIRLITDGDVSGAAAGGQRPLTGRPALGDRRHAGGRALRRRAEVHGRAAARPPLAARRRASARRRSTPATTSTGSSPPTTSCSGDDVFFAATGVTDGDLLQGVRYRGAGAHHRVAGDALALRHRPPRPRPPRPREAPRDHRRALRLTRQCKPAPSGVLGRAGCGSRTDVRSPCRRPSQA